MPETSLPSHQPRPPLALLHCPLSLAFRSVRGKWYRSNGCRLAETSARTNTQCWRRSHGEYFAKKGVMLMERHGKNAWSSAMRYAIRTLYWRTTSGVLSLTVLLELRATQWNVSMLVYLAAVTSLVFSQRKLIKFVRTGHLRLPPLQRRPENLLIPVWLLKMYLALQHSERQNVVYWQNYTLTISIRIRTSHSEDRMGYFVSTAGTFFLGIKFLFFSSIIDPFCRQKVMFFIHLLSFIGFYEFQLT